MRYLFARLDEISKVFGNFDKTLEIFDENSIQKLNFYLFFGKSFAKNRAFGTNIIFLQQLFRLQGFEPLTPAYATSQKSRKLVIIWHSQFGIWRVIICMSMWLEGDLLSKRAEANKYSRDAVSGLFVPDFEIFKINIVK